MLCVFLGMPSVLHAASSTFWPIGREVKRAPTVRYAVAAGSKRPQLARRQRKHITEATARTTSASAPSTNKAKMSDRKEKKHKKKKHKKDKKPRLHERVGYTDDDNPFGDRDLGATFVWKKKEDQSKRKKRPPPSRDEEDRIEEIEKVRRRRDARDCLLYTSPSPRD